MAEPPKLDWDHLKPGPNPDCEDHSSAGVLSYQANTLPPWKVGFRVVYPVGQKSSAGFCSLRTGFVQP